MGGARAGSEVFLARVGRGSLALREGDDRPRNSRPRNGSRTLAHSGPCSRIQAVGVKYASRTAGGGEPATKAEMKEWVVWISGEMVWGVVVVVEDIFVRGNGKGEGWRGGGDGDGYFCFVEREG